MLIAVGIQAKAQIWHVLLDANNTNGTAMSRYYIDSNKILHWEMTAQSPDPYVEDIYNSGPSWENMVQFNVDIPNSSAGVNEYYLDAETFPYGYTGYYSGTINLNAFTWNEITQMSCQTSFNRITNTAEDPYYVDYFILTTLEQ